MPLKQFKPPPGKKPSWMSHKDWMDHLEEVKAFDKRLYRQSGGKIAPTRSLIIRPKGK